MYCIAKNIEETGREHLPVSVIIIHTLYGYKEET